MMTVTVSWVSVLCVKIYISITSWNYAQSAIYFSMFASILMAKMTENLLICTGLQAERSNVCLCARVRMCVYTECTFKPWYSATLSSLQFAVLYWRWQLCGRHFLFTDSHGPPSKVAIMVGPAVLGVDCILYNVVQHHSAPCQWQRGSYIPNVSSTFTLEIINYCFLFL